MNTTEEIARDVTKQDSKKLKKINLKNSVFIFIFLKFLQICIIFSHSQLKLKEKLSLVPR